ncbi:MAG TPA: XdhC family protein [Pseudomonadota bacterium]|nr:XdhC family protein [Pseudomonadota bacterium]HND09857.1 XdhC family protein [Pseudomonadota bacterium]HNF97461.1 XdhC family protein [Pseudomonadota bacterium]HNN52257.1 XdhC family protein [Pseudomonadota bacterium]
MPHESASLFAQGLRWQSSGHRVAVASVVKTWGSSPRPPGSLLIICDSGEFVGSVSGGCIEGAVIAAAQNTLQDGVPQLLSFGVTQEMAWEVGLACGGRVEVFVERAEADTLQTIAQVLDARKPIVWVTALPSGRRWLFAGGDLADCPAAVRDLATAALGTDEATEATLDDGQRFFLLPFSPALRLLIFGAVHTAQPLCQMATACGFDVTVIDPRAAFATEARFPQVELVCEWPEPALQHVAIDRRTAVVTLTHDPKLDDPALVAALRSQAFYVGALGSGKTHAARLRRLSDLGFSSEQTARICGPVGLRISARSPAEIAVSILAQIISVLRSDGSRSIP